MIDENSIRDEIKKANIEYFRIKSKTYDNLFEEYQTEINRKVEKKIQRYTDSLKKGVCLDVGTGTWFLVLKEMKIFDKIFTADICKEMLLVFGQKVIGNKRVILIQSDIDNLPFRDNSFSFVSSFSVLHHLPYPFLSLWEIYRVLDNRGIFILFNEPNFTYNA